MSAFAVPDDLACGTCGVRVSLLPEDAPCSMCDGRSPKIAESRERAARFAAAYAELGPGGDQLELRALETELRYLGAWPLTPVAEPEKAKSR